ncbi:hypothetical protein IEQ34_019687 [Dendrobium chrysotoxum]|uniref:Uncharacterized protein n=1 Tax=Dendrobium chrysotoxum TaxID=161865 RepID=A0AAV7GAM3_DENCH|nr:hypothetical protein IEQ34_019687 [Dendrobium chrysotoxum]
MDELMMECIYGVLFDFKLDVSRTIASCLGNVQLVAPDRAAPTFSSQEGDGRTPCCEKVGLRKGKWTEEEDEILVKYITENGEGSWRSLPKNAGIDQAN